MHQSQHKPRGAYWQTSFSSALVKIANVDCRPYDLCCTAEFSFCDHRIAFVRRGYFRRHGAGEPLIADCNTAVFFSAHDGFRTSHPTLGGDECTFLSLSEDVLAEAIESNGERFDPARPFARTYAPIDAAALAESRLLFAAIAKGGASELEIEERSLRLARDVHRRRPARSVTLSKRARQLATRAQELLASAPHLRLGLGEMARRLETSPYHLSRTFHAAHGQSLYRYQTQLRLARAIERLTSGASDVTGVALDCGFSSHSHFTLVFRKATGLTPSQFRAAGSAARAR
jgi:AraC-like DNA-binding protein